MGHRQLEVDCDLPQPGAELATPLPSAEVADEILSQAEDLGYTHKDIASVHEVLARLAKNAAAVTS